MQSHINSLPLGMEVNLDGGRARNVSRRGVDRRSLNLLEVRPPHGLEELNSEVSNLHDSGGNIVVLSAELNHIKGRGLVTK